MQEQAKQLRKSRKKIINRDESMKDSIRKHVKDKI